MEIVGIASWLLVVCFFGLYFSLCYAMTKLARRCGIKKNLWFLYIPYLNGSILNRMANLPYYWYYTWVLAGFYHAITIIAFPTIESVPKFLLPLEVLIFYFIIIPEVWFWRIAVRFGYSGWWGIIWPLWLFLLDFETLDKSKVKSYKEMKKKR